jgi:hypothetical protein
MRTKFWSENLKRSFGTLAVQKKIILKQVVSATGGGCVNGIYILCHASVLHDESSLRNLVNSDFSGKANQY